MAEHAKEWPLKDLACEFANYLALNLAHSFRATGITVYLENNGTLETAQKIAAHESPRTTKLYDRTDDQLTLDEIEKISV